MNISILSMVIMIIIDSTILYDDEFSTNYDIESLLWMNSIYEWWVGDNRLTCFDHGFMLLLPVSEL